jgi:hypothetical protein
MAVVVVLVTICFISVAFLLYVLFALQRETQLRKTRQRTISQSVVRIPPPSLGTRVQLEDLNSVTEASAKSEEAEAISLPTQPVPIDGYFATKSMGRTHSETRPAFGEKRDAQRRPAR